MVEESEEDINRIIGRDERDNEGYNGRKRKGDLRKSLEEKEKRNEEEEDLRGSWMERNNDVERGFWI